MGVPENPPGRGGLVSLRPWLALGLFLPLLFALLRIGGAEEPPCPEASSHLLEAAESAEEPVVRESLLNKAIATCPKDPKAYLLLGRLYQSLDLKARARRAYAEALGRLPHLREILREIAKLEPEVQDRALLQTLEALLSSKEEGGVELPPEESPERLMARVPKDPKARLALAQELMSWGKEMLKNNRPGLPLMQRAFELVPWYARKALVDHHRTLGDYHYNGEAYDRALAQYLRGLQYDPEDAFLHLGAAESYSRMRGREEDALRHYRRADQLFAERGQEMSEGERTALQERIKRGLHRLDDTQPEYRQGRGARLHTEGRRLLARGDYRAASQALKEAIRWTPGNALLHFDLATALKQVPGQREEALRQFRRALALFETHPPPEVASLVGRFKARTQLEIDHLSGRTGSWLYILRQLALGAQGQALEIGLFVLSFAAIAAYLLRVGIRFSGAGAPGGGGTGSGPTQ